MTLLFGARVNTKAHFSALILQDASFLSPLTDDRGGRNSDSGMNYRTIRKNWDYTAVCAQDHTVINCNF